MGTNRTQPFGYKMEFGRIVIHSDEARWVTYIYEQYTLGASFKSLTDTMSHAGVCYDGNKRWNKNMIARILQDRRYIGDGKYQRIIDPATFQTVEEKRSKKVSCGMPTKTQKVLRRRCSCRVTPSIENEVLYLLNTLAGHPERITVPIAPKVQNPRLDALNAQLAGLLEKLPVDEAGAIEKLKEVAAATYESIGSAEYETMRMRAVFASMEPQPESDSQLIERIIAAVLVDSNGRVKIRLKNDQIIERGE